jgi:hypothetical protein
MKGARRAGPDFRMDEHCRIGACAIHLAIFQRLGNEGIASNSLNCGSRTSPNATSGRPSGRVSRDRRVTLFCLNPAGRFRCGPRRPHATGLTAKGINRWT